MTKSQSSRGAEKINYGIDAPGLVRFFFLAGGAVAALVLLLNWLLDVSLWLFALKAVLALAAIYLLGMGSLMLFWSKVVKLRRRDDLLDLVSWRGDEQVLDVGCGRGLLLIGAAKRLSTGQAMGIDVWDAKDQASTSPQVTLENARLAGVQDRVAVQTADARKLPFADQSFDVVMSHWVIHNIADAADRNRALAEMTRVLRPGGRLILNDIEFRDAYFKTVSELGLVQCRLLFRPVEDAILGALSFGSFRPTTLFAVKP